MSPFSIILPIKNDASVGELASCLTSLANQSLPPLETIVVIGPKANKKLFGVCKKFKVKVVKKNLTKSVARNYGVKRAKGKYLVHLDVNDALEKNVLKEAHLLIEKKGAKAIIVYENVSPISFISRIRKLERKFNYHDPHLATPQIIQTKLFNKIGGFNEKVDILDDWSLHFALAKQGVKFHSIKSTIIVSVKNDLLKILKRKYLRGQYIPIFKKIYPEYDNITYANRLGVYPKNWKLFINDPLASLGLILLKPIEWLVFYLGILNLIRASRDINLYEKQSVAKTFDQKQKSIYGRFKHKIETKALLALLGIPTGTILELGAGTGRVTRVLIAAGYKVTPTDVSIAMLNTYKNNNLNPKLHLPNPILITATTLPYPDNKFETVIAIRVIWHILDRTKREKFLAEAIRVAKKNIIMDFAIKGMGLNFLSKDDCLFTKEEIQNLAKRNKAKIADSKPLPLGRLLIKLEKISGVVST